MCYSLKSSIIAYGLATITSYLMYLRYSKFDKFIGPIIFAYSFMQLAEAFMWYDIKCNNKLNEIGGYIAYYSLSSHVLAMGVSLYLINKNKLGLIIGTLTLIYQTYNLPKINCSNKKNNIDWGFDSGFYRWIYLIIIILSFMINIHYKYKLLLIFWFTGTWFYFFHKQYNIQNLNYMFNGTELTNEFASLWCWSASISAPLIYLLGEYKF